MSAEGLDPTLLDTPDAIMPGTGDNAGSNTLEGSAGGMTVKEDPEYEKFFKLMKMGMPAEQIKLKMSAAGLKPELLDTPDAPSPNDKKGSSTTPSNGLLAGLPPKKEAVKVDESALKASLASKLKLQPSVSKKKGTKLIGLVLFYVFFFLYVVPSGRTTVTKERSHQTKC
jgi:hypothetical protein